MVGRFETRHVFGLRVEEGGDGVNVGLEGQFLLFLRGLGLLSHRERRGEMMFHTRIVRWGKTNCVLNYEFNLKLPIGSIHRVPVLQVLTSTACSYYLYFLRVCICFVMHVQEVLIGTYT